MEDVNENLRCAISNATLAALDGASQFLHSTGLETYVLPSLVQRFLDLVGYVDNRRDWNNVIPAMNEAVENLVEPEAVLGLAVLVYIANFASMQDLAFSS